jgi:hypothetical protein
MKRLVVLFSLFFVGSIAGYAQCCSNPKPECQQQPSDVVAMNVIDDDVASVTAYYFHLTRRCVTCQSVEKVTSEILKELYGDKIVLKAVNIEEAEGKALAKKLGVAGQSLMFINGDKSVNPINDGFMYARTNPEKLKEKIKETVNSIM